MYWLFLSLFLAYLLQACMDSETKSMQDKPEVSSISSTVTTTTAPAIVITCPGADGIPTTIHLAFTGISIVDTEHLCGLIMLQNNKMEE